jgi:acyl-CoA synthetase (NDP forming)
VTDQKHQLDALFNPSSIAIVGASNNMAKPGGRLTKYLLERGYRGAVYLVNNRESEIAGQRAYAKIADVPSNVDVVVLSVPVASLETVIAQMEGKGVRFVLVNASGFAEAGEQGQLLQDRLLHDLAVQGIRLCGPNTIGVFSPADSFFASFSPSMESPDIPAGSIGFITQSGALGGSILTRAWRAGIGFSRCVSSGNEADLTTADYIDYLTADPSTTVISVLLEGVRDGRRFRRALDDARLAGVPVLVYKNGRSEVGARAVQSHTGSLAGSDRIYNAVLKQSGAARLTRISHLYEVAHAFECQPLPAGKRAGIVSTSGGACTVLADQCADTGIEVPELTEKTTAALSRAIPAFGSARNPVDVTAQIGSDPLMMASSITTVLQDDNVDAVIVMLTTLVGPMAAGIAQGVADAVRDTAKTVIAVWTVDPDLAADGFAILRRAGLPVYQDPETAVAALAAMNQVAAGRRAVATHASPQQGG